MSTITHRVHEVHKETHTALPVKKQGRVTNHQKYMLKQNH